MPEFNPKARETSRGRHPDLDENGEFRDDVDLPRSQRDFYRMWQDEAQRDAFMYRLARQQSQLPADVQESVAGRSYNGYGSTPDPYAGYLEYLADIGHLRSGSNEVTGADIANMSLEQYSALAGQDVTYSVTSRDVDLRESMDPFTARELRNR